MVNTGIMKQAVIGLCETMREVGHEVNAEEIENIVEQYAIRTASTAVSQAACGLIIGPQVNARASTITMYERLANAMGVRLNKGLIKEVASSVIDNLAASATATITAMAAISFIPSVGRVASVTLTSITNFCFIYVAGLIFINLVATFGVSRVENMSEEEIKRAAKSVQDNIDVKAAMKEAKKVHKATRSMIH